MVKRKVFISYHHANDESYKVTFADKFKDCFINKSVTDGEYDEDLSTEYVKRLIREEKITDSSVVVVLIGSETYKRKHVDWEIYAGLTTKAGGRSGLIGILLPSYYNNSDNEYLDRKCYNGNTIPARLNDNQELSPPYSAIYKWESTQSKNSNGIYPVENWIEEAFQRKNDTNLECDNSREQMQRNKS